MHTIARLFVIPWYLLGWALHVFLGLIAPEVYRPFGATAIVPGYTRFWDNVIMPHITTWALVLAAFEIAVGCLLLAGGRWFKMGLTLSIGFNAFLVQMGLGFTEADALQSFMANRLPNLVFIAIQVPLLIRRDAPSIPALVRNWRSVSPRRARPSVIE
jgi:hypothetical protein